MAADGSLGPCNGHIVGAHTISRASALIRIARAGHVYTSDFSFSQLDRDGGVIQPRLRGINKTSTFNGFCKYHDCSIFRPLDSVDAVVTASFCSSAAYRAVAKELYLKEQLLADSEEFKLLERGRPLNEQLALRSMFASVDLGRRLAVKELHQYKSSLESEISGTRAATWVHHVVEVEGAPPPVLISAPFQPTVLPSGKPLQDLGDLNTPAQSVVFCTVPTKGGGAYLLSHRSTESIAASFVNAVMAMEPATLPAYLTALSFEMAENIAVAPDWWESLDEHFKRELVAAINRGASMLNLQNSEDNPMRLLNLPLPKWAAVTVRLVE